MIECLLRYYCRYAHGRPFRPVQGRYRCAVCLRTYAAWDNKEFMDREDTGLLLPITRRSTVDDPIRHIEETA